MSGQTLPSLWPWGPVSEDPPAPDGVWGPTCALQADVDPGVDQPTLLHYLPADRHTLGSLSNKKFVQVTGINYSCDM